MVYTRFLQQPDKANSCGPEGQAFLVGLIPCASATLATSVLIAYWKSANCSTYILKQTPRLITYNVANLGGPSYGLCCSTLSVCISVVWQSVLTSKPSECKSQSAPRCWHLHSSSVLFVCCRVRSRFSTAGTPAGLWHQLKSTSTTLLRPLTLDTACF